MPKKRKILESSTLSNNLIQLHTILNNLSNDELIQFFSSDLIIEKITSAFPHKKHQFIGPKIKELPTDTLINIVTFLDTKSIAMASIFQVCSEWRNSLYKSPQLWKQLAFTFWNLKFNSDLSAIRDYVLNRCRAIHLQPKLIDCSVELENQYLDGFTRKQYENDSKNITFSKYEYNRAKVWYGCGSGETNVYHLVDLKFRFWSSVLPTWIECIASYRIDEIPKYTGCDSNCLLKLQIDGEEICEENELEEDVFIVFLKKDKVIKICKKLWGKTRNDYLEMIEEILFELPCTENIQLQFAEQEKKQ